MWKLEEGLNVFLSKEKLALQQFDKGKHCYMKTKSVRYIRKDFLHTMHSCIMYSTSYHVIADNIATIEKNTNTNN